MFKWCPRHLDWCWIDDTQHFIYGMNTPNLNQLQFQWGLADGNESAHTLLLSPGSDISVDVTGGNVDRIIRIVIEENAGFAAANQQFNLESDLNASGTWELCTTTINGDGITVLGVNLTDRASSTQRVGAGTFFTPNDGQSTDGSAGGPNCDFAGNDEFEAVFELRFDSATLSDTDTVDFRVDTVNTRTAGSNARATIVKTAPSASGTGWETAGWF